MDIKKLREATGLTQVEVAVKVGCSLSSFRLWEAGVTTPNEENMKMLKSVLGISEEDV